ncbi:uncharacterized protein TRIVIDRAFT_213888 [Trichoderma virens Gv29-8]|uniref:SH3 domain-containing protein n=1 Tax=Hypocrea virens (strain Gv29-8 / FGSC 10586) TaxID=413071 RepID=G9N2W5_HYPVG|nr:uncharacterized protein TRIVIDRAFT_213888 [Trichoderma virens Gv29-8]EHK19024.1 hypothetical protein TRIVIDRAFT_213888 [Trichoderma virens Gv29-8]
MAALFRVKALYEYSSPHEDDLNFPAGQVIAVTDEDDADWYGGEYVDESGAKREGIFPRNFVEKFEPVAPPRPVRKHKQESEPAAAPPAPPPEPSYEDTAARSTPPPGDVASEPSPKRLAEPVRQSQPVEPPAAAPAPPVPAPAPVPVAVPASAPPPAAAPAPVPVPLPTSPKRADSPASAAPVASAPKPKAAPPPVSEKPSSFKDRIAAFNKSAAPPIAPFKPSGLGGGSASGFVKKPFVAPPPSRNAFVPPPREAPAAKIYRREEDPEIKERVAENQGQAERAGLVASETQKEGDEEDQPKPTSLKERIALLQKQQMEQAQRHADALSKKEKPKKPPPPKKRVDSQASAPEPAEGSEVPERRDTDESAPRASMDAAPSESAPLPPRPEFTESPGEATNEDEAAEADADDHTSRRLSKVPTSSSAAPAADVEQPVTETQETVEEEEEGEEEEEEEDVDPEVKRREELRARMAKMSGGMGFHGMFGAPPVPPMGGGLPKKKAPKPPTKSATTREEDVTPPPHAPPVPTMMALPGMGLPGLPVKPAEETRSEEEEDATPLAAAPVHTEEAPEHRAPPPIPQEDLSAPPVPLAARSPPPPPSAPPAVKSATEGSESDDELSNGARENPEAAAVLRSPPPLPAHPSEPPQSPPRPGAFSPTSPTSKRASRPPPPVPGAASILAAVTARPPPPPPPPGAPSRRSTVDFGVASPTRPAQAGEEIGEATEYEGDYDTDIASSVPHKDALAAHDQESSMEETSLQSPFNDAPPELPPPPPFASTPRAAPPPVPQSPPLNRRSTDLSRSVPILPPPAPPPRLVAPTAEENHDALFISHPRADDGDSPVLEDEPTPLSFDDSRAVSPPDRRVPPPVGSRGRSSMEMSRPSLSAPRRSIDHHRPSMDSGFIAGDIDLAVQSGWWKQSNQLPPVLQGRKDIHFECDESTTTNEGEKTIITRETFILFQDYSQTIITARYDPYDPTTVELEQRHEAPPKAMRQDQMEEAYDTFGRRISASAIAKKDQVVGDGTAPSFVLEMIRPLEDALLPISTRSYGALVYANMANASTQQHDVIRPGDIITIRNAKFQGKHGPMHAKYSSEVGKPDHVGVVAEWDGTKKKVRAWEQGRDGKKVKQESYKLDDLRSGEVKIWRVVSRSWVGWQKKLS